MPNIRVTPLYGMNKYIYVLAILYATAADAVLITFYY